MRINDIVTVPQGVTLTLGEGSRLRFAADAGLLVRGTLSGKGEENFLEFMAQGEDAWAGITVERGRIDLARFRLSGAESGITLVESEGVLTGGVITGCDTGLLLQGNIAPLVRELMVAENGVGIRLEGSAVRITGSAIMGNDDGIVADGFSGELRDSSFRDNSRAIVSERPMKIGPNWFGTTRGDELGISPAVTAELVYDAPLPGGKPVAPRDEPFRALSPEERQRRATELIVAAGEYFRQANYGKAATLFEQARQAAPSAELFYYLSLCHQQMQESDKALARLRDGVALFPRESLLWKSLGLLLVEQGEVDEARRALDEALRLSPEDRQVRFHRDRLGEVK